MKIALTIAAAVLGLALLYLAGVWFGAYGVHQGPGEITATAIPPAVVGARTQAQRRAGTDLMVRDPKQILFGDLHVHTTYSTDAFLISLPFMNGEGANPVGAACDYARFCSALDFWSINDHAEASTPARWQETKEMIRQCNAVTGSDSEPDVAAFLGWEWTQVGRSPENHYGHKNVIFRDLEDDQVPARAIGAAGLATDALRSSARAIPRLMPLVDFANRQRYYDFREYLEETAAVPECPEGVASTELPDDCYESAGTPESLFRKLDDWGFDSIVIPHGNTWGLYSPPGTTLDKQLTSAQNDPSKQILFEIMSGHGNSEEYRDWRAVTFDDEGVPVCPEPSQDYLPSCWRAGAIVMERCLAADIDAGDCRDRAAAARQHSAQASVAGHLTVPGEEPADWLDSGQCQDCYLPAFNYRPGGSGQYGLAISNFDSPGQPKRFRFGFIAASDNHTARPGTGYKELDRRSTTESIGANTPRWRERMALPPTDPEPTSQPFVFGTTEFDGTAFQLFETERQASFFTTGGLAAVHTDGRGRDEIWAALKRKETYGTSGDRILLWFHLLNAGPGGAAKRIPMGGEAPMSHNPRFEVRAVGAFHQKPGCPEYSVAALTPDRLQRLCKGECYNPSDRRKLITRIEVIRIRPQRKPGENVSALIEDPWRTFTCPPDPAGCVVEFGDPDFEAHGRSSVYYARAVQEPTPTVNGGQLRCERDAEGRCVEANLCYGDDRTDFDDDCLEATEERAWSSPIFVDFARSAAF